MSESEQDSKLPELLLVDDDEIFCHVLKPALGRRGFNVTVAHSVDEALLAIRDLIPEYAVLDLSMPGRSGLELVPELVALNKNMRIVMLTGYASIATAVEAIKLGATQYLTKPADADQIVAAFDSEEGNTATPVSQTPISVNRLEWEHIQKVLSECNGNISEAARQLNMHRRTLQRKLRKRPVKI